ncbi:hypothetical protein ACHAW5_009275 [Stephanodiscus triporus]|uniref:Uncharacterized protein n=1 Tax=Stephanodiscus triporus TaxID=2934178 RepID=A0ABD3N217_9STRA
MFAAVSRSVATRAAAPLARGHQGQRRGFINWMTNYPDKGDLNPTWLKQPGDTATLAFGALLVGYGAIQCAVGFYRLATGKGKKE